MPMSFFSSRAKKQYELDFSGNNISALQTRNFFRDAIHLDLSHSRLKIISADAWSELESVDKIYLNDNLLTTIPFVVNLSNFSFTTLSLYNNPLSCACDHLWFKSMLLTVIDRLEHPNAMNCDSPKRLKGRIIFNVDDANFCNDTETSPEEIISKETNLNAVIIPIAVGFALAALILASLLISRNFRFKFYTKFGVHPFDLDECDAEEIDYDVFISYAHEDSIQAREILTYLEQNYCHVCFHQRDFIIGETIINNILDAVSKSKRVLCLISENFLASSWCMEEFHVALTHSVKLKRQRIIAILISQFKFPNTSDEECSSDNEHLAQEDNPGSFSSSFSSSSSSSSFHCDKRFLSLKNFTDRHTYIVLGSPDWKQRLLYAMPVQRLKIGPQGWAKHYVFQLFHNILI